MAEHKAVPPAGRTKKRASLGSTVLCTWLVLAALPYPAASQTDSFVDGLAAFDGGDVAETVRIWTALAEIDDANAQVGLAGLYLAGNGVARNPAEAVRLYRLAADQGDSNGQLNLGRLYLDGVGIDRDLVAAYGWLSLAANQGRRWAEEKRQEIETLLSADQRAQAEAMIKDIGTR